MHSVSVQSAKLGFDRSLVYDVNVAVLIHYADRFKIRADWFKRLGLINLGDWSVHVTVLGSLGDGRDEIANGWSGVDVTFLEMASAQPIPKINGYYLWLANCGLRARWHLRVDDDSVSDIDGLLNYADSRFDNSPIHLMASPLHAEIGPAIFTNFLSRKGIKVPMTHEYEASLTSARAMQVVLADRRAISFLEETGMLFGGPGDRALALAMHMCSVPTAACPVMTKDFCRWEMSAAGGWYSHVHYVDWANTPFTTMLAALSEGVRQPFCDAYLPEIIGRPLEFGRCIGYPMNQLTLKPDGSIGGNIHHNEAAWRKTDNCVVLARSDGVATTILKTVVSHGRRKWLIGPHLPEQIFHYLEIS